MVAAATGTEQAIVAYCDGGLGNRLNSLIGALYFGRRLGLPVTISWPINRWCAAPFKDLFDAPYPVDDRSMLEINDQLPGHVLLAHERQVFTMPAALNPRVLRPGRLVARLRSELATASGILYFNSLVPRYISSREARALARTLHVKPEYRQHADQYLAGVGLFGEAVLGLAPRAALMRACRHAITISGSG